MQAKDLADDVMLRAVLEAQRANRQKWVTKHLPWASIWDLQEALPDIPVKVLRAKARKLILRGLMDGCTCGECRGDYETTRAGRDLLDAQN